MRNKDTPWFCEEVVAEGQILRSISSQAGVQLLNVLVIANANDCRRAFDLKQEAHLQWTRDRSRVNRDEVVHYQRSANVVYVEAGRQFSVRSTNIQMNAQCPNKWWSTLN